MGIGSIGSTPSFWQQDQSYWQQAEENDNATTATDSVINAISSAETNLGKGLASIANATALNRVNSQITALVQQALQSSGSSASSSSSGSAGASSGSSSSANANSTPSPATGTGTVVLTTGTSLATLGILPGGTITVGTGANTTTYTSTGSDTVADFLDAINVDLPTNANVTASLNAEGQLVITSRDDTSSIYIGGNGTDAAAIGFGVGNNTFLPKAASSSSTGSSSSSNASGSSTGSAASGSSSSSSKSTATNAAKRTQSYTTLAAEIASSAATLLSDSGEGGTLVDMLA